MFKNTFFEKNIFSIFSSKKISKGLNMVGQTLRTAGRMRALHVVAASMTLEHSTCHSDLILEIHLLRCLLGKLQTSVRRQLPTPPITIPPVAN